MDLALLYQSDQDLLGLPYFESNSGSLSVRAMTFKRVPFSVTSRSNAALRGRLTILRN